MSDLINRQEVRCVGRYIDADKLIIHKFTAQEASHNDMGGAYRQGWNDAIDAVVDNEPTADVVEVVRCKDCRFWNNKTDLTYCSKKTWLGTDAEDYCSFGERADT